MHPLPKVMKPTQPAEPIEHSEPTEPARAGVRRLAARLGLLGLVAVLLAGCVVAPYRGHYRGGYYGGYHGPRVSVWVPFPIFFVPLHGGYSDSRMERDRHECYRAAVRETGIDPGMTPLAESDQPRGGEVALGAAGGAAAGGLLAAPRHAGQGMVIGALLGAVAGAAAQESREARERAEQARRDRVQSESSRAEQEDFRRAMSACMANRGYRQR